MNEYLTADYIVRVANQFYENCEYGEPLLARGFRGSGSAPFRAFMRPRNSIRVKRDRGSAHGHREQTQLITRASRMAAAEAIPALLGRS